MKRAELMQQKITEQRKLPKERKEKIRKIAFINLLISIVLMIYLLIINTLYLNTELEVFTNIVKVVAIIFILIDIIIFETGYRKDNILIWIYGFELLVVSIFALAIPYIYVYSIVRKIIVFMPILVFVYYIAKIIFIRIFEIKKYQNNLSDVKEILRDDDQGYLDN